MITNIHRISHLIVPELINLHISAKPISLLLLVIDILYAVMTNQRLHQDTIKRRNICARFKLIITKKYRKSHRSIRLLLHRLVYFEIYDGCRCISYLV